MEEKSNTKWEKIKQIAKKYSGPIIKFGVPIALSLATGGIGGGIFSGFLNLLGKDKSGNNIEGDTLANFFKTGDDGLKNKLQGILSKDQLSLITEMKESITDFKEEIQNNRDNIELIFDQWKLEFGERMIQEHEITREIIENYAKDLKLQLDEIKQLSEENIKISYEISEKTYEIVTKIDNFEKIQDAVMHQINALQKDMSTISIIQHHTFKDALEILNILQNMEPNIEKISIKSITKEMDTVFDKLMNICVDLDERDKAKFGDSRIWYVLGRISLNQRKVHRSEIFFQMALRQDSRNPSIYASLAECHIEKKEYLIAEQRLKDGLSIENNNIQVLLTYEKLMVAQHKIDDMIAIYDKVSKLNPSNTLIWGIFASFLARQRRFQEALPKYQMGVSCAPNDYASHRNLGFCLLTLKRFKEADEEFDKALILNPNDIETKRLKALSAPLNKKFKESIQLLPDIIGINKAFNKFEDGIRTIKEKLTKEKNENF